MKRIFNRLFRPVFAIKSPQATAVATCIGIFAGLMPVGGIKIAGLLLIVFAFRINIFAAFLGMAFTVLIDTAVYFISYFTVLSVLISVIQQYVGLTVFLDILISAAFYPLFKRFYYRELEADDKILHRR